MISKRARNSFYTWAGERAVSKLPRCHVTQCWCGGALKPLKFTTLYQACTRCGCYANIHPPIPEALSQLYSLKHYWHLRQKMMGLPPIETRAELYQTDGRIGFWLELIKRFGPRTGTVVEIGCAPGVLLSRLNKAGYNCVGIEPDKSVSNWIRDNAGVEVREGLFPEVDLPSCDLLLAFDVAEHTPQPVAFWKRIGQLLRPGGIAIVQTPIEWRDYEEPFKTRREFFDGVEHLFLYTDVSIRKLTEIADLRLVALEDAMGGYLSQFCILAAPERSTQDSDEGGSQEHGLPCARQS